MKTKPQLLPFISIVAVALSGSVTAFAQQVPQPKSAADIPGMPDKTVMTKEYVETVGRMAYLWVGRWSTT